MSTPAGWYDDGSGRQRWWDGTKWTDQFAPEAPTTDAAPAATDAGVPPYVASPAAGSPAPGAAAAPYAAAAPAGAAGTGTKPKPHILAWIALGAAALGFILACIPVTAIIALVLLPIALILSIVALFMKGAKWPAITGLILAVVGGIIGAIVLVVALVSAGVQALDEISDTSVSSSPQDDTDDADAEEGADADGVGSQENPAPLGSTISGDEYDVVVNSVNLDATEEIVAANPFNEAPADGYAYALVNATVTYTGDETGYAIMAQFAYLTSGGEVIESTEAVVVPPEPALGLAELTPDTSATGNLVLQVPVDDDGLIRVTPGILADAVFVAVQ